LDADHIRIAATIKATAGSRNGTIGTVDLIGELDVTKAGIVDGGGAASVGKKLVQGSAMIDLEWNAIRSSKKTHGAWLNGREILTRGNHGKGGCFATGTATAPSRVVRANKECFFAVSQAQQIIIWKGEATKGALNLTRQAGITKAGKFRSGATARLSPNFFSGQAFNSRSIG
jgi:hypothetical protein